MFYSRSSYPEVFCKKGVLRNSEKSTEKDLCQSLFLNKVTGFRPANLFKKRLLHTCFPVNFTIFLRTPFVTEHLRWMLLWLIDQKYSHWKFFSVLNGDKNVHCRRDHTGVCFLFIALTFQPCKTFKYPTKIYKFGRVGKILKSGIIKW